MKEIDKASLRQKKAHELLEKMKQPIKRMSIKLTIPGQKQRIAIARSLAMEPDVLLLASNVSAGSEMAGEVLNVMKELTAGSVTMVVMARTKWDLPVVGTLIFMDGGDCGRRPSRSRESHKWSVHNRSYQKY